jgi:hypothetical protein
MKPPGPIPPPASLQPKSALGRCQVLRRRHHPPGDDAFDLQPSARITRHPIRSLDEIQDGDHELLWAEEAERRYGEIERGEVSPIPSEDVFREARARLR